MKRSCTWILGGLCWLLSVSAWAQADSLLREADRLLSYRAYGRAIDLYSQLLTEPAQPLTATQRTAVQSSLAYAYRQVGDGAKAETAYREALLNNPNPDPQQVLLYAQTLANNGEFTEGQQQYERYLQLKAAQPARERLTMSSSVGTAIQSSGKKEATRYRLEYLSLNTANEEFSPAYYGEGLVYVAGKKGGSTIETLGNGGGSGYLDLFYIPNRSALKVADITTADGNTTKATNERAKRDSYTGRQIGADAYTRPTANDSRTVGTFDSGIRISQGLGYDRRSERVSDPSKRFSESLNTRYHEGPATFTHDGSRIIFTRNNYNEGRASKSTEGVNKLKLYTATQQNGEWGDSEELPFNSNEYSVGHPTLSADDQLLFFASDMPGGFGGTDLYVSRYENGQWTRPVNLGNTINTKGNELFPFADESGNLYFASDGRKGLGGLDIFYATLSGIGVTRVDPLDAPINSPQDDFGLITDGNRQAGYFSSNRRNGSDDIFRFIRESSLYGCRDLTLRVYDSETNQPLDSVLVEVRAKGEGRIDEQLITDQNGQLRLCLEGNNDFTFRSSRDGYISSMVGFSTRYLTDDQPSRLEVSLAKPTFQIDTLDAAPAQPVINLNRSRVRGRVLGPNKQPIEGVLVTLKNECDGSIRSTTTGPDGKYFFELAEGCAYTLSASKEKYGTNTNKIKRLPKKSKPKEVSADLPLLSVGDVFTLENIYYDLDRTSLRSDATRELDKLVATMRKYPSLIIEIRSHTDSRGDATYNKQLSAARARSVANYIVSKGIASRRVKATGFGESQLVNNCTDGVICTEAEHQRNRRTEFKVLAIK